MTKRGRPAEIEIVEKSPKYEVHYENEDSVEVWKYNTKISSCGPVEVDITYKKGVVADWGDKLKEVKATKKIAKQMKQIEAKQATNKASKRGRPKRM